MADLYKSEAWLRRKFFVDKMKPEDIARLCGVNEKTIRRYIDKLGLKK